MLPTPVPAEHAPATPPVPPPASHDSWLQRRLDAMPDAARRRVVLVAMWAPVPFFLAVALWSAAIGYEAWLVWLGLACAAVQALLAVREQVAPGSTGGAATDRASTRGSSSAGR